MKECIALYAVAALVVLGWPSPRAASCVEAGLLLEVVAPVTTKVAAASPAPAPEIAPRRGRPLHGAPAWEKDRATIARERRALVNGPIGEPAPVTVADSR